MNKKTDYRSNNNENLCFLKQALTEKDNDLFIDKIIQAYRKHISEMELVSYELHQKAKVKVVCICNENQLPKEILLVKKLLGQKRKIKTVFNPLSDEQILITDNLENRDEAMRLAILDLIRFKGALTLLEGKLTPLIECVYNTMKIEQIDHYSKKFHTNSKEIITTAYIQEMYSNDIYDSQMLQVNSQIRELLENVFNVELPHELLILS